ncbi:hypothetical protein [Kordiimonas marina]|uniref:hypothetical protein n=1 Tax=Kordiimonas marina TaxID=2872312 RepID=UPI001FF141C8|nr:hypothetical protein [Kordiimonas marina]MCJ9427998.1 hypothetical protein [Kordiimonas marina]
MKTGSFKSAVAAAALLFGTTSPAWADATLMGSSICDNQADSFDYLWIAANNNNPDLYFLSGNSVNNGAINAVGHNNQFNNANNVYIAVHGGVDQVDAFSGTAFAQLFLNNHGNVPTSVTFYVCQSGTVPNNGVSSMAAVAQSYPGNQQNSTLIQTVTAPGPNSCPALAVNSAQPPVNPIGNLALAVYHTGIQHTQAYNGLLNTLLTEWAGGNNVVYPNTNLSFQGYCQQQLGVDATGQWVPAFITAVNNQFGADYLALVNANYDGNALATCGVGQQCN